MPLWVWMVMLAALIKLPIAALLLWIPFRYDESMRAPEAQDSSEEDGGSKALPGGPLDPHPRGSLPHRPRRGPHGGCPPPSPPRIRTAARGRRLVRAGR
jgi:hypothetical protein